MQHDTLMATGYCSDRQFSIVDIRPDLQLVHGRTMRINPLTKAHPRSLESLVTHVTTLGD